jgi:hypothetical protein
MRNGVVADGAVGSQSAAAPSRFSLRRLAHDSAGAAIRPSTADSSVEMSGPIESARSKIERPRDECRQQGDRIGLQYASSLERASRLSSDARPDREASMQTTIPMASPSMQMPLAHELRKMTSSREEMNPEGGMRGISLVTPPRGLSTSVHFARSMQARRASLSVRGALSSGRHGGRMKMDAVQSIDSESEVE